MREQIIAQISLGINSGDLPAGEKLPSTRELARRFQIHQNTVSAAYRRLAERDLVEFKKGSGVYVREYVRENAAVEKDALEQIINRFFQESAAHGFSTAEIKARLQKRFDVKPATRFLVVESDAELRKILIEEVSDVVGSRVEGISFEDLSGDREDETEVLLIFNKAENFEQALPSNRDCFHLKANSVPDSMSGKKRPSGDDLIAVVSGWEHFLALAKMFLLAARIAPETLLVRSTGESTWRNGLPNVALIICDSATAKNFSDDGRVRVFRLIADSSLDKLRESIE